MSLHECTHIHLVMAPDGNFYKTLRYHTALQNFSEKKGVWTANQNAPPQEGATEEWSLIIFNPQKGNFNEESCTCKPKKWILTNQKLNFIKKIALVNQKDILHFARKNWMLNSKKWIWIFTEKRVGSWGCHQTPSVPDSQRHQRFHSGHGSCEGWCWWPARG